MLKEVIENINNTRTQQSASKKDEVTVMQAMLNDFDFIVDLRNGDETMSYSPASTYRAMLGSQIHKAAKIPQMEAVEMANNYEVTKSDATIQVNIAKDFVSTYMETGRKLPLGVRNDSDVSLIRKTVAECDRTYPKKVGVNEDGSDRYEKASTHVPAHNSIRVISNCPDHLKNN